MSLVCDFEMVVQITTVKTVSAEMVMPKGPHQYVTYPVTYDRKPCSAESWEISRNLRWKISGNLF